MTDLRDSVMPLRILSMRARKNWNSNSFSDLKGLYSLLGLLYKNDGGGMLVGNFRKTSEEVPQFRLMGVAQTENNI